MLLSRKLRGGPNAHDVPACRHVKRISRPEATDHRNAAFAIRERLHHSASLVQPGHADAQCELLSPSFAWSGTCLVDRRDNGLCRRPPRSHNTSTGLQKSSVPSGRIPNDHRPHSRQAFCKNGPSVTCPGAQCAGSFARAGVAAGGDQGSDDPQRLGGTLCGRAA